MEMYQTTSDLDSYFAGRLHTRAWDDANETDRRKASIEATRIIDRLAYKDCPDSANTDGNKFPFLGEEIPRQVLDAHAEITYSLLDGVEPDKEYEKLTVSSERIGSVGSTYSPSIPEHTVAGIPSIAAWRLLKPYLRAAQEIKLRRV